MIPSIPATDGSATAGGREWSAPYTDGDLAGGWEFKVVRSPLGLFARRDFRERILAEEGRAGWVLLEVFDDHTLRLKRQPKHHPEPEIEGYDPYRIVVDGPEQARRSRREGALALLAIAVVPVLVTLAVAAAGGLR